MLELLRGLGFGNWGMLLTMLAIIFVLGFFIDWIEIVLITLPIFEPVLKSLDCSGYVGSPELAALWMLCSRQARNKHEQILPPDGFGARSRRQLHD